MKPVKEMNMSTILEEFSGLPKPTPDSLVMVRTADGHTWKLAVVSSKMFTDESIKTYEWVYVDADLIGVEGEKVPCASSLSSGGQTGALIGSWTQTFKEENVEPWDRVLEALVIS